MTRDKGASTRPMTEAVLEEALSHAVSCLLTDAALRARAETLVVGISCRFPFLFSNQGKTNKWH